jgi:hypothetical protein
MLCFSIAMGRRTAEAVLNCARLSLPVPDFLAIHILKRNASVLVGLSKLTVLINSASLARVPVRGAGPDTMTGLLRERQDAVEQRRAVAQETLPALRPAIIGAMMPRRRVVLIKARILNREIRRQLDIGVLFVRLIGRVARGIRVHAVKVMFQTTPSAVGGEKGCCGPKRLVLRVKAALLIRPIPIAQRVKAPAGVILQKEGVFKALISKKRKIKFYGNKYG